MSLSKLYITPRLVEVLFEYGIDCVSINRDGSLYKRNFNPIGVYSGSFNPLHFGHLQVAAEAEKILGGPIHCELSLKNCDKGDVSFLEIVSRMYQFSNKCLVEITNKPLFKDKALLFPGTTFVMGQDTAARFLDNKYYKEHFSIDKVLSYICGRLSCKFLVFPRDGTPPLSIPKGFDKYFGFVGNFAPIDVSSTSIRNRTV